MKKHFFLVLIAILSINFLLPRLMPGDPFLYLEVEDGNIDTTYSEEQIENYRAYYGLDKPLTTQFFNYIIGLLHGDLGYSIYYNTRVTSMILARLPWSLLLVTSSLFLSSGLGAILGAVSAFRKDKKSDKVFYSIMVGISEIPGFLLGVLFLFVFAASMKLFPLSGAMTHFAQYSSGFERMADILSHAALPVMTLTVSHIGEFYMLSRASMMTIISKNYMRTAEGKGLHRYRIFFHHLLRSAFPPILARIVMSFGRMIGGAVLVENIFAYPGLGALMKEAVFNRDYPLMQGAFLVIALSVLLLNWLAEKIYSKLDPRMN